MRATDAKTFSPRCAGALALSAVLACNLVFPSLAFAVVRVDENELAQGTNEVGSGTATLSGSSLEMTGVNGATFYTDEDLDILFADGKEFDEAIVEDATVSMSFTGDNGVEDVYALGDSDVTINIDGHNGLEEINASGSSSVTVNVTGENDLESIGARDDASLTVRGASCQKKDVVNLGEGEVVSYLASDTGDVTIDHVTVNVKAIESVVGSCDGGALTVDTSKIASADDNGHIIIAGGKSSLIRESVIDIIGTIVSTDKLTIEHSDVKVAEPAAEFADPFPYRIVAPNGIELIGQKNGTVIPATYEGENVFYVDTEGNQGQTVDLKADSRPAYYKCKGEDEENREEVEKSAAAPAAGLAAKALPRTGDAGAPVAIVSAAAILAGIAGFASRKREQR